MLVLGLSGGYSRPEEDFVHDLPRWFFHDSAAALIRDGELTCAVEEERLSRLKHTNRFPSHAIRACLQEAGVRATEIDRIGYFYGREYADAEVALQHLKRGLDSRMTADHYLRTRLTEVDHGFQTTPVVYVQHHLTHARMALEHSGLPSALVLVMDGNGEDESTSVYHSPDGKTLDLLATYPEEASLGHFYSSAIELVGYQRFDEYKVMGLAPYGDSGRWRPVFDSLVTLGPNGSFSLDWEHVRSRFLRASFPVRARSEEIASEHRDFAAGLQAVLQQVTQHIVGYWQKQSGERHLCLAGGVAQNCTNNGALLLTGGFERVFAHPAAHDGGAAVGAAMVASGQPISRSTELTSVFFGPSMGDADETRTRLAGWRPAVRFSRLADASGHAAQALAMGACIGWFQGRSELGPRALGHRSILADPRPASNKDRINAVVKKREAYRPFAPSVLAERLHEIFDIPAGATTPFMTFNVPVREEWRSRLLAVTHIDGSARVQGVAASDDPRFHKLIASFGVLTGVPVVLNTSFNNHAEPIVESVDDAVACFLTTQLDFMIVSDYLVERDVPVADLAGRAVVSLPAHVELHTHRRPGLEETVLRENYPGGRSASVSAAVREFLVHSCLAAASAGQSSTPRPPAGGVWHELLELWSDRLVEVRFCAT